MSKEIYEVYEVYARSFEDIPWKEYWKDNGFTLEKNARLVRISKTYKDAEMVAIHIPTWVRAEFKPDGELRWYTHHGAVLRKCEYDDDLQFVRQLGKALLCTIPNEADGGEI